MWKAAHFGKIGSVKAPSEEVLNGIQRQSRRHYSAKDKIRVVLEGLRCEESIAQLRHRDGIAAFMYSGEVKELRRR